MNLNDINIFNPEHTAHIKLDRARHVGTVFPPENGAHFNQDGMLFDAHGNLVVEAMDEASQKRLHKAIIKKHADIEAEKARRAVYEQLGINERDLEDPEAAKKIVANLAGSSAAQDGVAGFDVLSWARGEVKAPWFKVRSAAQEQFGLAFDDKQHLLERLVELKKIKPEEIKV